jgi:hypothetical protein
LCRRFNSAPSHQFNGLTSRLQCADKPTTNLQNSVGVLGAEKNHLHWPITKNGRIGLSSDKGGKSHHRRAVPTSTLDGRGRLRRGLGSCGEDRLAVTAQAGGPDNQARTAVTKSFVTENKLRSIHFLFRFAVLRDANPRSSRMNQNLKSWQLRMRLCPRGAKDRWQSAR